MKKKLSKLRLTRETLQQLSNATGGIPVATTFCEPSESCGGGVCYPTGPGNYCGYTYFCTGGASGCDL